VGYVGGGVRLPFLNDHIHQLLDLSSELLITPPDVYSTLKSVVFTISPRSDTSS